MLAPGCVHFGQSCDDSLHGATITLARRTTGPGVRVADIAAVQGCAGSQCGTGTVPDGTGLSLFRIATYGSQDSVRLTDVGGQVQVDAVFHVFEGQNPVSIRLVTKDGTSYVLSGTIEWDDDGCHKEAVSTAL